MGLRPVGTARARPAEKEKNTSMMNEPNEQTPPPVARKSRWGTFFRAIAIVVVLVLAAGVAFLNTPYAGDALNYASNAWDNLFSREAELQAGADLEALGALVVYRTGTGSVESVNYQGRVLEESDLVPLMSLNRLLLLDLRNTNVTDDDLKYLKNLSNLATLVLSGTAITDEGMTHLVRLKYLEALHLTETAVSDPGLAHLKKLSNLAVLDLSETEVTDEGLQHLVGLAKLRWLLLSGTEVTDRGLETLAAMKDLRRLTVENTGVTPEGIGQLEKAVPGIAIDR